MGNENTDNPSHRLNSCEGKMAFASRRIATKASRRKRGREAYKCDFCRKWHVGNVPGGGSGKPLKEI